MKRGTSEYSLVVGIKKPKGISSHDVVNRVRKIFGERRIGHAGTLDPLAEGVLPVLVGPAARLDKYLVGHDKSYIMEACFGYATATDDSEGDVLRTSCIAAEAYDEHYARNVLEGIVGKSMQVPPAYSAIKVDGRKACDEARRGNIIELKPREIEIYSAELIEVHPNDDGTVSWLCELSVSKGTYIRAIARDLGSDIGTASHMRSLARNRVGCLSIRDCCSLEELELEKDGAALDPVKLLGFRFAAVGSESASKIRNGQQLSMRGIELLEYDAGALFDACSCVSGVQASYDAPKDGELVSVIDSNKLIAIARYSAMRDCLKPECVFQIGVSRGSNTGIR